VSINNIDLYYIESPGQLIIAIEIISIRKIKCILLIRIAGSKYNREQMNNTLAFYKKKDISEYLNEIKLVDSFYMFLWSFLKYNFLYRFEKVFVGSFKSRFLSVFRLIRFKVTLIDDGTATFLYYSRLRKNSNFSFVMDLYTCLPLKPIIPSQLVEYQEYNYLKSHINREREEDCVWFFGAKYVESFIVSESNYLAMLKEVKKFFQNKNIKYIPHRQESEANLAKYELIGFNIKRFQFPSELELVKSTKIPNTIAGFYSASLLTSSILFPDINIISFKISCFEDDAPVEMNSIDDTYACLENFAEVIELED